MAGIGWIDFSPDHQKKVAAVIDLLQPQGQVDELGIGVIRNAFSDLFFPGTSTIQTRAKYFLLIPRIFREYQVRFEHKQPRPLLQDYLKKRENRIIRTLAKKYHGTSEQGIFGITLVGKPGKQELARKPSSVYWTGLRSFGLIRTSLSLAEYLARHDHQESFIDLIEMTAEDKGDDEDAGYEDTFGIRLPDNNEKWDQNLSIALTHEEAAFLRDQILDHHHDRLIAQVLQKRGLVKVFVKAMNFRDMCDVLCEKSIPQEIQTYLHLAKDFDAIIHGAHVRYNCLLQHKYGTDSKLEEFKKEWNQWWQPITASDGIIHKFDEDRLFELSQTLRPYTKSFVQHWIDGIRRQKPIDYFDRLVIDQEKNNKGKKARLSLESHEKVDDWIGISGLHYRFPVVKDIVIDIKQGIGW
jgi:hypothetical protein